MISKTIGCRGLAYFQTNPNVEVDFSWATLVTASGDFTMIKNDDWPMNSMVIFPWNMVIYLVMAIEIVDLAMNSMVDLSSLLCDSLPEGTMIDCSLQWLIVHYNDWLFITMITHN